MTGVPISSEQPRPHAPVARLRVSHDGASRGPRAEAMELFRCRSCGEVIGVYEPLVVRARGAARVTSRAAEPDLEAAAAYYHRDCYRAPGVLSLLRD